MARNLRQRKESNIKSSAKYSVFENLETSVPVINGIGREWHMRSMTRIKPLMLRKTCRIAFIEPGFFVESRMTNYIISGCMQLNFRDCILVVVIVQAIFVVDKSFD